MGQHLFQRVHPSLLFPNLWKFHLRLHVCSKDALCCRGVKNTHWIVKNCLGFQWWVLLVGPGVVEIDKCGKVLSCETGLRLWAPGQLKGCIKCKLCDLFLRYILLSTRWKANTAVLIRRWPGEGFQAGEEAGQPGTIINLHLWRTERKEGNIFI